MAMTKADKDMFDSLDESDKGYSQAIAVLFQYAIKELAARDVKQEDLEFVAKRMEKLHYLITKLLNKKERGS
jgi:hypothetical protein